MATMDTHGKLIQQYREELEDTSLAGYAASFIQQAPLILNLDQ